MRTLDTIHAEIDDLSERRTGLWEVLSRGHDPGVRDEIKTLDEQLQGLWDEVRAVKARLRFGERDKIIARARQEERLERAA